MSYRSLMPRSKWPFWPLLPLTAAVTSWVLVGILQIFGYAFIERAAGMPFLLFLLVFCLVLSRTEATLMACLVAALIYTLSYANDEKIAATTLPLSAVDLKMFLIHPTTSLNILKFPVWPFWGGVALISAFFLWLFFRLLKGIHRTIQRKEFKVVLPKIAVGIGILIALLVFSQRYIYFANKHFEAADAVWAPKGVARLAHETGIVGFLLYTYALDRAHYGDYFGKATLRSDLTPDSIIGAAQQYVAPAAQTPNIVVVLAESTFDANYVFELRSTVRSPLFSNNEHTKARGILYVNAVGGGTWITEFEILTGIDSRLFGYWGYYTHASVAPMVRNSVVTYFRRKGYSTVAFYPIDGIFYNARKAYAKYGFETFVDKKELNLKAPGWSVTDEQMVDAVTNFARDRPAGPIFYFIVLVENHAPHPCRHFNSESEFITIFDRPASFAQNCTLNEYLRILDSTSRAQDKLLKFLQMEELRTGRPFVLLLFGDHQPHSFTGTGTGRDLDFKPFRKQLDPRFTYFHLMSSLANVVNCCGSAIPHVTFLPSLISAYTAKDVGDLYLAVNFFAFKECGPYLMRSPIVPGLYAKLEPAGNALQCSAYDEILAAYRKANLIGLDNGTIGKR